MAEIKPIYEHSKIGNLCFNITTNCTKVFIKHR